MYTANEIADWFLRNVDTESGDTISHLKLQKLVYYAQAWHYTLFNTPLFEEKIEAWMHGPVVRSIYDRFKDVAVYSQIDINTLQLEAPEISGKSLDLLSEIREIYGEHSAKYLEDLTHEEDPWIIARNGIPNYAYCEQEITLSSMKEFYSAKLDVA